MSAASLAQADGPERARPRLRSHAGRTQERAADRHSHDSRPLAAGNQALQRHLRSSIAFPHEARLRALMPVPVPLTARLDPTGCAVRGAVAYTDGSVSYFGAARPSLHVAAHEAAHQLQHAGVTRDAWLGAEGHAGAVADAAVAGAVPRGLVGGRGKRVQSATRNYVETDKDGNWKGLKDVHGGRISETGETLTFGSHEAFATPALISAAGAILKAKRSGIAISPGAAGKVVEAPDGSGPKPLAHVEVVLEGDPNKGDFASDCREASKKVMGAEKAPEAAICSPGGVSGIVYPVPGGDPRNLVVLVAMLDDRIRKTSGFESLTKEEKQKIVNQVYAEFENLTSAQREKRRDWPISDERAKTMGINQWAAPGVGEAFAIYRSKPANVGQYDFHYATVIMAAGENRVTLENAGGAPGEQSKDWKMQTYGPTRLHQSFHEEWVRMGSGWNTLAVTTQLMPPTYYADIPNLPTDELLRRFARSTDLGEQKYLGDELKKRQFQVTVTVEVQSDWLNDDVYVLYQRGDGFFLRTEVRQTKKGQTRTFVSSIGMVWPLLDPLSVSVYDEDAFVDDLIGEINIRAPFAPLGPITLTGGGARYVVSFRPL